MVMNLFRCIGLLLSLSLLTSLSFGQGAPPQPPPPSPVQLSAIGEWDGVTASAKMTGPYEDPGQANVPFGIISYFNTPWRSYMDTWSASRMTNFCGTQYNVDIKYTEALCQLLEESGIRNMRVEIGWGGTGWDDDLMPHMKVRFTQIFSILKKHNIRPLILLNAHHGVPCPVRDVWVEVLADAKKGDKIIKFKDTNRIRIGYTGFQHPAYIAAYPMITKLDDDGTVYLSSGLPYDVKAGRYCLKEVKYQPFQGAKLKDGTLIPAAKETFDGWMRYAANVGKFVRESLGTDEKSDVGFDVEVWNEQTFGSNFLDINNYYDDKFQFAESFVYKHERDMKPEYAPTARLKFEEKNYRYTVLPGTIDYFNDPKNGFQGVHVISGFANQWPWDNGTGLWDNQAGFSRHYYTGGWRDSSPVTPLNQKNSGVIDATGNFEGKKDHKDWHTVEPGSFFIPTFRLGCPEFMFTGFKTEHITRDLMPDSRLVLFRGHGRYTHNGDFRIAEVWQTEVNYDRSQFFTDLKKETGATDDNPQMQALDIHLAGKNMLRQYIFQASKGLYRIFMFSPQSDPYSIGMLPKAFYQALDKNKYELNEEVRKTVPPEFTGLGWLVRLMDTGKTIKTPRQLQVNELIEYKPRLAYPGDGTLAHPNRWNRDNFAFMPYQLSTNQFVIPYYVATLDVTHVWDKTKPAMDPARYDMPEQDFDVTIGNIRGVGAIVSGYDLLTNTDVPVQIVASTDNSLTVRLKTVDYPRVLRVTEKQAGPQILDARAELQKDGSISVSWRTNIPVSSASVSYGRSWERRDDNVINLEKDKTVYQVSIPALGMKGVPSVRIRVGVNGLTNIWPRWDEDPAGQVVIPIQVDKVTGTPVEAPLGPPTALPKAEVTLVAPDAAILPVTETNAIRGYTVMLPKDTVCTGPADNRDSLIGGTALRIRFIPKGYTMMDEYLPQFSVSDIQDRQMVILADVKTKGLIAEYQFAATAHPGMTNLNQQYLMVKVGKDDLLIISVQGTPEAMVAQEKIIKAIFAGVTVK
jgi:hypothetical protein